MCHKISDITIESTKKTILKISFSFVLNLRILSTLSIILKKLDTNRLPAIPAVKLMPNEAKNNAALKASSTTISPCQLKKLNIISSLNYAFYVFLYAVNLLLHKFRTNLPFMISSYGLVHVQKSKIIELTMYKPF